MYGKHGIRVKKRDAETSRVERSPVLFRFLRLLASALLTLLLCAWLTNSGRGLVQALSVQQQHVSAFFAVGGNGEERCAPESLPMRSAIAVEFKCESDPDEKDRRYASGEESALATHRRDAPCACGWVEYGAFEPPRFTDEPGLPRGPPV